MKGNDKKDVELFLNLLMGAVTKKGIDRQIDKRIRQ